MLCQPKINNLPTKFLSLKQYDPKKYKNSQSTRTKWKAEMLQTGMEVFDNFSSQLLWSLKQRFTKKEGGKVGGKNWSLGKFDNKNVIKPKNRTLPSDLFTTKWTPLQEFWKKFIKDLQILNPSASKVSKSLVKSKVPFVY